MSVPPPPWSRPERPPPARAPLSRETIISAGFIVLERDGLEAFSMRRVAQQLGTGAASLYAHVASKDELLELMLDRAIGDVRLPQPDPAHWQEQLKEIAREGRRVLSRPGLAQISLARIPTGPNALLNAECVLAIGRAGGLPERVNAYLIDLLALYIGAVAYEETLWLAKHGPRGQAAFVERLQQVQAYFSSLPPERFPNIVGLAGVMLQPEGDDDRFEFGLDILVRGMAAYAVSRTRDPEKESS